MKRNDVTDFTDQLVSWHKYFTR